MRLAPRSRRLLLQEGAEGGANGAAAEGLLHPEVVHHALLHFLLRRGEEQAAEHGQLRAREEGRREERGGRGRGQSERNAESKQVPPSPPAHTLPAQIRELKTFEPQVAKFLRSFKLKFKESFCPP